MKIPNTAGRFSLVALFFIAAASIYLLNKMPSGFQTFGADVGSAGGIGCFLLLRFYRGSLSEVEEVPQRDLSLASATKKRILILLKIIMLALCIVSLGYYLSAVIYNISLYNLSPIVSGIFGIVFAAFRELAGATLSSREFIKRTRNEK
jgi:hypothetical protein